MLLLLGKHYTKIMYGDKEVRCNEYLVMSTKKTDFKKIICEC